MADSLLDLSAKVLRGELAPNEGDLHPFAPMDRIEEVAPGVAFYKNLVNVTVVKTPEGVVLVDTGSHIPPAQAACFARVRTYATERINTAIYTHGHADHAYGLPPFLAEAQAKSWAPPSIVAHDDVLPRMQRYAETHGYNQLINRRQFAYPIPWPKEYQAPTRTFAKELDLDVGGVTFELRHARGETDDHAWVFLPQTRVLCTGDFIIWAAPNAGNPQKVQRYAKEWAAALRKMAEKKPLFLLPGHGLPVAGEAAVQAVLLDTAEYLSELHKSTIALLNEGRRATDIALTVKPPQHLLDRPYLQPVYDEPEFIVRNVVRCYGGWYSGVPSELKPASFPNVSAEIARFAGGPTALIDRAEEIAQGGDYRLACHLIDWAGEVAPDDERLHRARARMYEARADHETSTMARGIFRDIAARDREWIAEHGFPSQASVKTKSAT